jgi:hypothetical protein
MSEIKVDKLQGTSGSDTAITLSGANATVGGTLAVTGVHTIGNNAIYTSDGSAVTQNTVQSLLKGWMRFKGDGTISIDDSFNYASIADNGTGDYTTTLSNAMSNRFYSPTAGAGDVDYGAKIDLEHSDINTTTAMRLRTAGTNSGTGDTDLISTQIAGDLA